jgi:prepilin-type N-terminal cleavage/methylation domain-containing protein
MAWRSMMQRGRLYKRGFSLVELLMALMVTAIILSAVVSLAFAFTSAHEDTANMSKNQAILRYATLRLRDSIRFSNSIDRIYCYVDKAYYIAGYLAGYVIEIEYETATLEMRSRRELYRRQGYRRELYRNLGLRIMDG